MVLLSYVPFLEETWLHIFISLSSFLFFSILFLISFRCYISFIWYYRIHLSTKVRYIPLNAFSLLQSLYWSGCHIFFRLYFFFPWDRLEGSLMKAWMQMWWQEALNHLVWPHFILLPREVMWELWTNCLKEVLISMLEPRVPVHVSAWIIHNYLT